MSYANALYFAPGAGAPRSGLISNLDESSSPPTATITHVNAAGEIVTTTDVPECSLSVAPCVADFGDLNGETTAGAIGAYYETTDADDAEPCTFTARDPSTGNWSGVRADGTPFSDVPVPDPVGVDPTKGGWIKAPTGY